ncbi:MAG: shikimate dehydrogenase [Bacteroidetes bacterium]|nr:shikimate dehydrogenase [Bacteroidota bacterium]
MGYPLTHSFSQKYFSDKFKTLNLSGYSYKLFPVDHIMQFPELIMRNPSLMGMNITIPYKVDIMNFLDQVDHEAAEVGAVNTLKIRQTVGDIIVKGYNTDIYGFEVSLLNFIPDTQIKALVFGNGGASKAVVYVLKKLEIPYQVVSRNPKGDEMSFNDVTEELYSSHLLLINTTPVGMSPDTASKLDLPYETLSAHHYVYDLIYNPDKTAFLTEAEKQGAHIKNGLEMLHLQADKAFEIWEDSKVK